VPYWSQRPPRINRGAFSTATVRHATGIEIEMRYLLIALLCLVMLQGCSSGSGGTVSPPQGDNNAGGGDHAGGHH
jgi:hypothetical protein